MGRSRRLFLHDAAAMAAVLLLPASRGAVASSLDAGDAPSFSAHVAGRFSLSRNGRRVATLRLESVDPSTQFKGFRDPWAAARGNFSLTFRSAESASLKDGIYTFTAPGLVPFEAFVSAVDAKGFSYQVVFNRVAA